MVVSWELRSLAAWEVPILELLTFLRSFNFDCRFRIGRGGIPALDDRKMDPQGPAIMNVSGVYNLSEIWPAFQMGAPTTSFGVGADPMAARNRTQKARKRSEEDECAKPRASASNGNAVSDSIATVMG